MKAYPEKPQESEPVNIGDVIRPMMEKLTNDEQAPMDAFADLLDYWFGDD